MWVYFLLLLFPTKRIDLFFFKVNVAVSLTNGVFQFPLTECRRELANNDTFTTHMKELHDENINVSICADKQGKKRAFNYDMEMFDFSTGAKRALDNQENIV